MLATAARKRTPSRSLRTDDLFDRLRALAMNLYWSWHHPTQQLFAAMDPQLFLATRQNPLKTIALLSPERRDALQTDAVFLAGLKACEIALKKYLGAKTWFARHEARSFSRSTKPLVAYLCAEYAIHESLQQYSGGLGVLAGDHVKSASDLGLPFVGVGLLYRCGYYTQEFRDDGSTRVIYPQLDFDHLCVSDTGKSIAVPMAGTVVHARIWQQQVGRVELYLLDTDIEENSPQDRALTRHLYGGDREYRIRQEILLGVGGVMALEAMGLEPTVYHLNEGHAAFASLHRLVARVEGGGEMESARAHVRASTVFTTHTPVPAGNDRFAPDLAWKYIGHYAKSLDFSRDQLLALGREDERDTKEDFCMTVLALKLADHCNGVAKLHGETSRRMWMRVYGAKKPNQVPITSITNGVHPETWLAPEIRPLYDRFLKPDWISPAPLDNPWKRVANIPARELHDARNMLRKRLINYVRRRLAEQAIRRCASPEEIALAHTALDEDTLTIGFARRFATYKRAPLVFKDAKRLSRILNNPKRPVQLIFAGKAHPADAGGQSFAQEIHQIARHNGFVGKVVLLEDYDMHMGRMLTSGCDVWLNNPLRPQEASGTSGMKPPLHGGLNCSILDGWWPEACNDINGWAIGDGREFASQEKQDAYDARCIYELIEKSIAPEFYDRGRAGVSEKWTRRMRNSLATVCAQFSTHRMVGEYWSRFYKPASR